MYFDPKRKEYFWLRRKRERDGSLPDVRSIVSACRVGNGNGSACNEIV